MELQTLSERTQFAAGLVPAMNSSLHLSCLIACLQNEALLQWARLLSMKWQRTYMLEQLMSR